MSRQPLTITQLHTHQNEMLDPSLTTTQYFKRLQELYAAFQVNEHNLTRMEFGAELIAQEKEYERLKNECAAEHQVLKNRYKLIDDRILAVEQKLYFGIPDNLTEMDKLILEQESIVADQETLNEAEAILLEKMSKIDVEHGKQLAKLDQSKTNRDLPLNSKFEAIQQQLEAEEKQIQVKSNLYILFPVLILLIALDYLVQRLIFSDVTVGKSHSMLHHFIFLIGFILSELFLTAKLKAKLAAVLAQKATGSRIAELEQNLNENEQKTRRIEQNLQLQRSEILQTLGEQL